MKEKVHPYYQRPPPLGRPEGFTIHSRDCLAVNSRLGSLGTSKRALNWVLPAAKGYWHYAGLLDNEKMQVFITDALGWEGIRLLNYFTSRKADSAVAVNHAFVSVTLKGSEDCP
jgi:hypothetical protein